MTRPAARSATSARGPGWPTSTSTAPTSRCSRCGATGPTPASKPPEPHRIRPARPAAADNATGRAGSCLLGRKTKNSAMRNFACSSDALPAGSFSFNYKDFLGRRWLSCLVRCDRIEHMIEQLATASDAELLAELRELEAELSRVQYRQLSVLAELNSRNVPGQLGLRGLADLIAAQVRCTRVEARRRARAVQRFGARRALTGEVLEPVYPATASALSDGAIGFEHAAVIADTVETIPAADRAEHASIVESTLLEHARTVDPRTVRLLGQRILAHLDPDGPSPDH